MVTAPYAAPRWWWGPGDRAAQPRGRSAWKRRRTPGAVRWGAGPTPPLGPLGFLGSLSLLPWFPCVWCARGALPRTRGQSIPSLSPSSRVCCVGLCPEMCARGSWRSGGWRLAPKSAQAALQPAEVPRVQTQPENKAELKEAAGEERKGSEQAPPAAVASARELRLPRNRKSGGFKEKKKKREKSSPITSGEVTNLPGR